MILEETTSSTTTTATPTVIVDSKTDKIQEDDEDSMLAKELQRLENLEDSYQNEESGFGLFGSEDPLPNPWGSSGSTQQTINPPVTTTTTTTIHTPTTIQPLDNNNNNKISSKNPTYACPLCKAPGFTDDDLYNHVFTAHAREKHTMKRQVNTNTHYYLYLSYFRR